MTARLVRMPLEEVVKSLAVGLWVNARDLCTVMREGLEERFPVFSGVVLLFFCHVPKTNERIEKDKRNNSGKM